jgi:hypothetical protein
LQHFEKHLKYYRKIWENTQTCCNLLERLTTSVHSLAPKDIQVCYKLNTHIQQRNPIFVSYAAKIMQHLTCQFTTYRVRVHNKMCMSLLQIIQTYTTLKPYIYIIRRENHTPSQMCIHNILHVSTQQNTYELVTNWAHIYNIKTLDLYHAPWKPYIISHVGSQHIMCEFTTNCLWVYYKLNTRIQH